MQNIVIIGNLGKDAETLSGKAGKDYVKFSVGVSNGKDKDSTWYQAVCFGQTAKYAGNLRKGEKVAVSGRLEVSENNGKTWLSVVADSVEGLAPKIKTVRDDEYDPFE